MPYAEALQLPRQTIDRWVAPDVETMKGRFDGLEIERVREMLSTDEGKKQLLTMMKESDPSVSEHVDKILPLIDRNVEQLEKKESFLTKMAMMPVHAMKAVGKTIVKHPVLSAIGAAGTVALLFYFFGPAASTVGVLGQKAIETFGETVLGNVPTAIPDAAMDAAANVPAIGGLMGPEAAVQAAEGAQSAGSLMLQNMGAAESAGMSDGAMKAISGAADAVLANPALEQGVNPVQQFFDTIPTP